MLRKQRSFIVKVILVVTAVLFWLLAAAVPVSAESLPVSFDGSSENIPRGGLYIAKEGKTKLSFSVDGSNGLRVYRNKVLIDVSGFGPGEEREYTEAYSVRAENFARDLRGGYLDMIIRCRKLKVVSGTVKKAVTPSATAVEENDRCLSLLSMSDGSAVASAFSVFSDPERLAFGAEQILELSFVYHDTGELYGEKVNYSFTDLDQGDYLEFKRQFFTNKRGFMETISLDSGFTKAHVVVPENEWLLRILGDAVFIPTATDSNTQRSGFIAEGSGAVTVTWTGSECGTEMVDLFENRGGIRLNKVSSDPALTDGNPKYCTGGAGFGIYSDAGCTQEVMSFETDDDGIAHTGFELAPGTYFVKEKSAPGGYALSDEIYEAAVENGMMTEITVPESPLSITAESLLAKVDSVTGGAPQGDGELAGALYTVSLFGTEDISGEPLFEAVFKTDEAGRLMHEGAGPVSGTWPCKAADGRNLIPAGFLAVKELQAPAGYGISDEVILYHVYQEGEGLAMRLMDADAADAEDSAGNDMQLMSAGAAGAFFHKEKIDVFGGAAVKKLEGQTGQGLKGAEFSVINMSVGPVASGGVLYNRGEEIMVIVTDDSGSASMGETLPYGTYVLKEKTAPAGYLTDEEWSETFTVREDGMILPVKPCIDYRIPFEHGSTVTSYKSAAPERGSLVKPGDTITYTVETVNTGACAAENIRVRDYIPFGTAYTEGSVTGNGAYVPAEMSENGCPYVEWTFDSIDVTACESVSFSVTVSEEPPRYIENIAYTSMDPEPLEPGDPQNPAPSDETDAVWHVTSEEDDAPCTVKAVLSSQPVPGSEVIPGDIIDYFITVTNVSGRDAQDICVFDSVPEGTEYLEGSADSGGVFSGTGVGWKIDSLPAGESMVLGFSVTVNDDCEGGFIIRDRATWGTGDAVPERDLEDNSTNVTEHVTGRVPEETETETKEPDTGETETGEPETEKRDAEDRPASGGNKGGTGGAGPQARIRKENVKTGDGFQPGITAAVCLLAAAALAALFTHRMIRKRRGL